MEFVSSWGVSLLGCDREASCQHPSQAWQSVFIETLLSETSLDISQYRTQVFLAVAQSGDRSLQICDPNLKGHFVNDLRVLDR